MSNEKLFSVIFKGFAPESIATENVTMAARFIKGLRGKAVVKPLDEKGGKGILETRSGDPKLSALLDKATHYGQKKIMIQQFVSARRYGDKRILILNGEILGAFLRKPPSWDFRANLSLGGTMHPANVSRADKELVKAVTPQLLARGLYFVGIDVIGKYITEANVTSPAGIPEINHFNKTELEKKVADFIEKRVARKRS